MRPKVVGTFSVQVRLAVVDVLCGQGADVVAVHLGTVTENS